MSVQHFKVFISYAIGKVEHTAWVERFASDLIDQGIDVKFDKFEVGYGDDFRSFMIDGIAESNYFLFVCTDESRKVADRELPNANKRGLWFELRKAQARLKKVGMDFKQICVLLEGDAPPNRFKNRLKNSRCIDFRDQSRYAARLHELAMELKFGRPKPPLPTPDVAWKVGAVTVPDIIPEFVFVGENALMSEQVRSTYEDSPTDISAELRPAGDDYVGRMQQEALRMGVTFDDNASYDLRGISIARPQTADGGRRNIYTLHTRPSTTTLRSRTSCWMSRWR